MARKRPVPGAEPSRPSKRPQVASPSEPAVAGAESDREPIIALSVLTVPIEAPSEERSVEGAAPSEGRTVEESIEDVPVAQPVEEVRAEVRELEQPASAVAAPSGGTQSDSSMPSLSDVRAWVSTRGKAPMAPGDDRRSAGRGASTDSPLPEEASALANHDLARRLCQAVILSANIEVMKNQRVSDMLSSFYPTIIRISLSPFHFRCHFSYVRSSNGWLCCLQLIYNISELEARYRRFSDLRAAWKDKAMAVEANKVILVDQLKQSVDREARLEGEISHLTEEVSRLNGALAASGIELQSAREDAKRKSRTVRRLHREQDDFAKELKAEASSSE